MRSAPARVEHRQRAALSGLLSQCATRWLARCSLRASRAELWWRTMAGLALGVVMMLSYDVITPFWTVTDQITPPDTDWLSVLMCRERTGPA